MVFGIYDYKIIVTTPDRNNIGSFKEVFRHSISVDDSIDFDYKSLLKGIKVLFPDKQLFINLNIM